MIKNFFEKDSVLKVVSLFVAVLVWLYVIYIEDPEIETTIDDVAVAFKTSELSENLSVVEYGTKFIDVEVKGSRSDIMALENDDLDAVIDLSSITEAGDYNAKLKISTSNKRIEIVEASEEKSRVKIDDIVSKKFKVKPEFKNKMPEGYIVTNNPETEIDEIWIKGPKTYIDDISGAYVMIDQSKLKKDQTVESKVYLKDKKGKVIDKNHKAYKDVTLEVESVSVYVEIGKTTKAKVEVLGADEFEIISVSPAEIEIYNPDGRVDKIYTKSIKDKEPDREGYIMGSLDIPETATVIDPLKPVKIKVNKK